jgi:hypothetical protein
LADRTTSANDLERSPDARKKTRDLHENGGSKSEREENRMSRDVSGRWVIHQSNGFEVAFDIVQNSDGGLHGSGKVTGGLEANGIGQVSDDAFLFVVDWHNNGGGGDYNGTFDPVGRLTGITHDLANASSQATWYSDRFFPA